MTRNVERTALLDDNSEYGFWPKALTGKVSGFRAFVFPYSIDVSNLLSCDSELFGK